MNHLLAPRIGAAVRVLLLLAVLLVPAALDAAPDDPGSPHAVYLPIIRAPSQVLVAPALEPFDADAEDLVGPSDWMANYGKAPEIIVASSGSGLDILAQDYDPATPWNAVLLHVAGNAAAYRITQVLTNIPMLDRVMGLDVDAAGNRYYATAVDESAQVNPNYPPPNTWRSNIVRVIKLDPAGHVLFDVDLDPARHAFDPNAEMIINPMVAATARLAVGGGEVALVHGINTGPDWNIGGVRHQKALSTRLDTNGNVTRTSSIWVSHSFDERLLYDGQGITELHLGDAYPRWVVLGRNHNPYALFHIKGPVGENLTATRLGNLALIRNDPVYGYLALFATESTPELAGGQIVNGPRNLAIVRVNRNDGSVDLSLPDVLTVNSAGSVETNRLRWLTAYSADSARHAERPKLVPVGDDLYVVLWEQWRTVTADQDQFEGVYALLIDALGNARRPITLVTAQHHLPRGDDAFVLDGRAGWVTGSAASRSLLIHLVDAELRYQAVTLQ
ncbi:MAG: hypothetical protein ACM30E_03935 [Nitrososphaerales archaeon]